MSHGTLPMSHVTLQTSHVALPMRPRKEEIRLQIITTAIISNKFSREVLYTSNTFSLKSQKIQIGFHVNKRSPRHPKNGVPVTQSKRSPSHPRSKRSPRHPKNGVPVTQSKRSPCHPKSNQSSRHPSSKDLPGNRVGLEIQIFWSLIYSVSGMWPCSQSSLTYCDVLWRIETYIWVIHMCVSLIYSVSGMWPCSYSSLTYCDVLRRIFEALICVTCHTANESCHTANESWHTANESWHIATHVSWRIETYIWGIHMCDMSHCQWVMAHCQWVMSHCQWVMSYCQWVMSHCQWVMSHMPRANQASLSLRMSHTSFIFVKSHVLETKPGSRDKKALTLCTQPWIINRHPVSLHPIP